MLIKILQHIINCLKFRSKTKMKGKKEMQKELSSHLNRYYFVINTYEKVLLAIEEELKESNQWFIFCSKIGKKFDTHLNSLVFNVTQDLLNIQIDEINVSRQLDLSLLFTNLRLQLDTYSTFYHIFIHDGDWDEKIIRFRLWQIDSLLSRQGFSHDNAPELKPQIISEQNEIKEYYKIISELDYFKKLLPKQKERLIKNNKGELSNANWKFDTSLLNGKKIKYSWEELALNTGIKDSIYSNMHDYTSMHVHSNYISIIQNDTLNDEEKHISRIVVIMLSSYLTSFYIDDLSGRFRSAKKICQALSEKETDIIKTFLQHGRDPQKIKFFTRP